jgi:ATP-dependent DNA helicase RecG
MIAVCKEMGLPSPEFVELGGQFRVTLFLVATQDMALDDTNRAIIDLLGQANGLSVKNIAATIGLSTRAIRSRIGKLVEKGLVTVVGTGPRDPKRKFFLAGKSVTKYS